MALAYRCCKCNSANVMTNLHIAPNGDSSDVSVEILEEPDAMIFKGLSRFQIRASVCADCGLTELFTENPQALFQIYKKIISRG